MRRLITFLVLLCIPALSYAQNVASPTLNSVRDRGTVVCGVDDDFDGFAKANSLGEYAGFSIDLCRAISAAIFADSDKTEFISGDADDVFPDLLNRRFDVLLRNTTWTLSREASVGDFTGIYYYDGQGFMAWKRAQVRSALELDNISLCVHNDPDVETNAANYFSVNQLRYKPVPFATANEANEAYSDGLCDALTANQSTLAALRSRQDDPNAHRILSAVVSKEPLGAMVRANDKTWANLVRWSLYCMINAEELGITKDNIGNIGADDSINLQRLAGLTGDYGEQLGLDNTWCADIIRTVGNYGESYERHLGEASQINLPRGFNNLWINGGLIFAPPIR